MARDHTELDCWKLCEELEKRVHEITSRPAFTDGNLKEQLDEAVDSPCANIGEGFSRYYPKDNAKFVRVAKGSLTEVMEHMRNVRRKGYATAEECGDITYLARRARGAVTGYARYLESATAPTPPSAQPRRQPIDPPRRRDSRRRTPGRQKANSRMPTPGREPKSQMQNPGTMETSEPRNTNRNPENPRNPET